MRWMVLVVWFVFFFVCVCCCFFFLKRCCWGNLNCSTCVWERKKGRGESGWHKVLSLHCSAAALQALIKLVWASAAVLLSQQWAPHSLQCSSLLKGPRVSLGRRCAMKQRQDPKQVSWPVPGENNLFLVRLLWWTLGRNNAPPSFHIITNWPQFKALC